MVDVDDELVTGWSSGWTAELSPDGRERAESAARRNSPHDLVGLVDIWAACAQTIGLDEGGKYYDDYFYYLSQRDALEAVVAELAEADAAVVRRAMEPADAYFRTSTIDDGGAALARKFRLPSDAWYWQRVPPRGPIARSLDVGEGHSTS